MQLPAVPGSDRPPVSPPFPGPRVDPDDPARLQAAEPLPDQPRILLPLLDLRQRTRPPPPHRNSRTHRVLRRPLESALFNWGQSVGLGASFVVTTGNESDVEALEVADA